MADRTPLVYVASPITGDPWGCVRRATNTAAVLRDLGCHAYLPQLSVLHEMVDPQPYEHWIEHGLAMIERCDGLLRLTGDSPGADLEVELASELFLPRLTVDHLERGVPYRQVIEWLNAVRARAARR